jgi:tRNA A-37 threonylcarbamoyl transferase component Bud32
VDYKGHFGSTAKDDLHSSPSPHAHPERAGEGGGAAIFGWPSLPCTLQLADSASDHPELVCEEVVRCLPGKRLACFGRWRGREVFIKLFIDPKRAHAHARREERGVRALIDSGIATPALLHSGRTREGNSRVLVFERIAPAISLLDACNSPQRDRRELLTRMMGVLACHHEAGLIQRDLHLRNFIISGDRIFTLDGADVQVNKGAIGKDQALDNLALFFSQFFPETHAWAEDLYCHYAELRNSDVKKQDTAALQARIESHRERRQKDYLRKMFRECSAIVCVAGADHVYLCERSFHSPAMQALLANPDRAFHRHAEFLKQGNTSTLVKARVDDHVLVIKRYNIKGFWHGINRALMMTRGAKSWRNAHLLKFHGAATARPVALLERRIGPFKRASYFISEHVAGVDCRSYFSDPSIPNDARRSAAKSVVVLLGALAALKLTHGDLKASNIIMSAGGPVIVDLDAMRQHKSGFARARRRDIERFLSNWDRDPFTRELFEEMLANRKQPENREALRASTSFLKNSLSTGDRGT